MSYAWTAGPTEIELTSVSDGRSHLITAQAFASGVREGHGSYRAACGADVIATSLMMGPGPPCRHCERSDARRPTGQRRGSQWSSS